MHVSVFGLGYVGCVSAACMATDGHTVIGVDVNPEKVNSIHAGSSPVIEPRLQKLIAAATHSERLTATVDPAHAVRATQASVVCVGTPSARNGTPKHDQIEAVCGEIADALRGSCTYHLVMIRSTVLPGTVEARLIPILEQRSGRRAGRDFGVCMVPEFLREGSAVADYYHPSYVIIGQLDDRSGECAENLFRLINAPVLRTGLRAAEMVKYASNAFHALKISFANEIGVLSKRHAIDGRQIMELLCRDRVLNISATYLTPGFAFGGSCLGKDLRALLHQARESSTEARLIAAILESNRNHLEHAIDLVEGTGFQNIGLLGLSFKSGTDDVRESASLSLAETLIGRGYSLAIYDEYVDPARLIGQNRAFLERELPHIAGLMRSSLEEVVDEADAVVIATANPTHRRVAYLVRPGQRVIDLVGAFGSADELPEGYEGICW